ncbi:MAG: STAS domain-containing protein [Bacillota bacterium]
MKIKTNYINNSKASIKIEGNIDFVTSDKLKDEILTLIDENYKNIIIDLENIKKIDSSGLGSLLLIHKRLKDKEGELVIKNSFNENIKRVFETIELDQTIKIE